MNRREFTQLVAGVASLGGLANLSSATAAQPTTTMKATSGSVGSRVLRANRTEWAKEHFRGFENVLVASFKPDTLELDEAGIRLDVRKTIEHGFFSTLISPNSLSTNELKRVIEICVDEAAGRLSVAFSLHPGPEEYMLDMLEHAERAGAQHLLLDVPREGSSDELYNYVAKYSESTNLGIYLWMAQIHKFDRFHASAVPFEFYDRAADLPNVIALKVGNMDPAVLFELFERYNDRMLIGSLWPNIMPMAIKAYGQQWSGAWTVEALQSPEKPDTVEFFNLAMAGKHEQAMKLYWSNVAPGFGAMMKMMGAYMPSGAHPWELIKYYQFCVGGNGGPMRVDPEYPDLPPVSAQDMAFVRDTYKRLEIPTTELPDAAFSVGRVNWEAGIRPTG